MLAQSDRGTITGTISDPAGAVIAHASVEARNTETRAVYPVDGSATGNYAIALLPAGTYELRVSAPGFKKLIRPGVIIQAAETVRVDATLELGSAAESVTVQAEALLLKTGELSNTIATGTMDTLPLLAVGSNSSGNSEPVQHRGAVTGSLLPARASFYRTYRAHQWRSYGLGNGFD